MKKKVIALILVLLMSLLLAATFVACDPHEKDPQGLSITAEYDVERGEVTFTPNEAESVYEKGDEVTAHIAPKSPYIVTSVVLKTYDLESVLDFTPSTDGSCDVTFTVNEDSVLAVKFGLLRFIYNAERGDVSSDVEDPKIGDQVTLTFSAKEGYRLGSFTTNNIPRTTSTNQYEFTLNEATVVNVTFVGQQMPTAIFNSLKGQVKFEGEYFYDHSIDEYDMHINIATIFGQDTFVYQIETDKVTGEVYQEALYRNVNDKLATTFKTILNTLEDRVSDDDYAEYGNPFDYTSLSATDFAKAGENVYEMVNISAMRTLATPITGYYESIASVKLTVNGEKAVKLEIVTEPIDTPRVEEGSYYVSTYEFNVIDNGTARVPAELTEPLTRQPEHDRLEAALNSAAAAQTYKAHMYQHEVGYEVPEGGETRPGYGDVERDIYITPSFGYTDIITNSFGYNELSSGYVVKETSGEPYLYPFEYDKVTNKVTLTDPYAEGADYFRPSYDINEFSIELFRYVGNNIFELDQNRLYLSQYDSYDVVSVIAPFVAPYFMLLHERVFEYATNLKIELTNDNTLKSLYFVYTTYGFSEERTVTYNFGWDDVDGLGLNFDEADKTSKLDPFKGTFVDDNGNNIVVDEFGFVINGTPAEVVSYSEESGATFTVDWEEQAGAPPIRLYIMLYALNVLRVSDESGMLFWTLDRVSSGVVTIPENYRHVWTFRDEDENRDYHIRIQTHALFLNGTALELISFDPNEGVSAQNGDLIFTFAVEDAEGEDLLYCYIEYENSAHQKMWVRGYAEKTTQSIGVEIPDEYIGVYTGVEATIIDHRVDITYSGIMIDGDAFTINSYTKEDGFRGRYRGQTATIVFNNFGDVYNYDLLHVSVGSSSYSLDRAFVIQQRYVGVWEPRTEQDLTLVITDTQIVWNGVVYSNEQITYDDSVGRYSIQPQNSAYTLYLQYTIDRHSGGAIIYVYSNDESLLVSFVKVSDEPVITAIPERCVDTWKGKHIATGDEYTLEITSSSIHLTITRASGETESYDVEIESVETSSAEIGIDVIIDGKISSISLYPDPNDDRQNEVLNLTLDYENRIYIPMHRASE